MKERILAGKRRATTGKNPIAYLVLFCLITALLFNGCLRKRNNYAYLDPYGMFCLDIPGGWEKIISNTFSPFKDKGDPSRAMMQIVTMPTNLSGAWEEGKKMVIAHKNKIGDKILSQTIRKIGGVEAWDIEGLTTALGGIKRTHEIIFIYTHNYYAIFFAASPEFYSKMNPQFEDSLKT